MSIKIEWTQRAAGRVPGEQESVELTPFIQGCLKAGRVFIVPEVKAVDPEAKAAERAAKQAKLKDTMAALEAAQAAETAAEAAVYEDPASVAEEAPVEQPGAGSGSDS